MADELDGIWSYPLGSAQVYNKVRRQYEPPPAEPARLGLCTSHVVMFLIKESAKEEVYYYYYFAVHVCQCLH